MALPWEVCGAKSKENGMTFSGNTPSNANEFLDEWDGLDSAHRY